jgi:excinuclease UvrABC nuclease subunit
VIYNNSDLDKLKIIKNNKGKSGIYRWVNQDSGKTYVGSSVNLGKRLTFYFSPTSNPPLPFIFFL